jgi:hypothetical protein
MVRYLKNVDDPLPYRLALESFIDFDGFDEQGGTVMKPLNGLFQFLRMQRKRSEPPLDIEKHGSEGNLPAKGQLLVYQADNGKIRIDVRLEHETVWLTQKQMAELFQTSVPNINMRIKNIFDEGEPAPDPVIQEFLITAPDGTF